MTAPLEGIRIIEVGHMLAGPYCTMMLADMGAEIIKIETPAGDIGRSISPHFIGPHNAYFASLNRSKKSVVIDLASDEGHNELVRIVQSAHALVTNLRPSAIRKLGLTYADLRKHNPKIVCVALTGYGLDGPYAEKPAYDYVIQALTGVMALTGDPETPPTKAGFSVVDNTAGMVSAIGLLAKIVQGTGGQVDVAMYDVMLSQLNYLAGATINSGENVVRQSNSSHPYIVPAQVFPTMSGWLTVFIAHDSLWRSLCEEIGRPEWKNDPEFATMAARRKNRTKVIELVGEELLKESAEYWVSRLVPRGIVAAEVNTLGDALQGNLVKTRELVVPLEGGKDGEPVLRAIASPIRFSDYVPYYRVPPLLNENADEFLGKEVS
jgi:CoA:oxalate CoA-transferase